MTVQEIEALVSLLANRGGLPDLSANIRTWVNLGVRALLRQNEFEHLHIVPASLTVAIPSTYALFGGWYNDGWLVAQAATAAYNFQYPYNDTLTYPASQAYTNDPAAGLNIVLNMANTSIFVAGCQVAVSSSAGTENTTVLSVVLNTNITVNQLALNHTAVNPLVTRIVTPALCSRLRYLKLFDFSGGFVKDIDIFPSYAEFLGYSRSIVETGEPQYAIIRQPPTTSGYAPAILEIRPIPDVKYPLAIGWQKVNLPGLYQNGDINFLTELYPMAVVYATMMVVCEFLQEIDAAKHYEQQAVKEISIVVDGEKKKQLQDLGHTSYWTGAATPAHNPGKRIFYARDF